mmetsp:Transcript_57021/g.160956  ORF Transcript_57021/g.160956 Transcript_57021/m.160956 type:complete len:364 (-) Transcript_57021:117-1208(-)
MRDFRVVLTALGINRILQQPLCGLEPVERPIHDALRDRLVAGHMQGVEVWQFQRRLRRGPLRRVEGQHPVDRLPALRAGLRVDGGPLPPLAPREAVEELHRGAAAGQPGEVLGARGPQDGQDLPDLVQVVLAREDGPAAEQLAEDAPHRPDVDGRRVLRRQEDHLRGAVPARHDVPRQHPCAPLGVGIICARVRGGRPLAAPRRCRRSTRQLRRLRGCPLRAGDSPREAKIADLHGVPVHEAVRWLEVTMVNASGVDVLEAHEGAVKQRVGGGEADPGACFEQLLQVRVTLLHDYEELVEAPPAGRLNDVMDSHHVRMVQPCQYGHLSQDALAVREVIEEGADLLYRHRRLCLLVVRLAYTPV